MSTLVSILQPSRLWLNVLKITVVMVFAFLLYQSFTQKDQWQILYSAFVRESYLHAPGYLMAALSFVYLNWWLEALKWRKLVHPFLQLEKLESMKAVLMGLTTSIFTPNRVGEFVGRLITVKTDKKIQAATAIGLGSLIQLLLISSMGFMSIGYLTWHTYPLPGINTNSLFWILVAISVAICFVLLRYLNVFIRFFETWFRRLFPAWWPDLEYIHRLPFSYFASVLFISGCRVLIYILQYWFLLQFFHVDVRFDLAISTITLGYFIQSGLPLPSYLGLIARGEIALLLWRFFDVNELSILAASYGLWVINVVLPALVGMIYLMRLKIKII